MFEISFIPAFKDNYIWLLHEGNDAAIVDPGDANAVIWRLKAENLNLRAILVTHHHADHTQGIPELKAKHGCRVTAPKNAAAKVADVDAT